MVNLSNLIQIQERSQALSFLLYLFKKIVIGKIACATIICHKSIQIKYFTYFVLVKLFASLYNQDKKILVKSLKFLFTCFLYCLKFLLLWENQMGVLYYKLSNVSQLLIWATHCQSIRNFMKVSFEI